MSAGNANVYNIVYHMFILSGELPAFLIVLLLFI